MVRGHVYHVLQGRISLPDPMEWSGAWHVTPVDLMIRSKSQIVQPLKIIGVSANRTPSALITATSTARNVPAVLKVSTREAECTPTSDTVCEDIGTPHPKANGGPDDSLSVALLVSIGLTTIIVACVVVFLLYRRKQIKEARKLAELRNEVYQRLPAQERVDNLRAQEAYRPLGQQEKKNYIQVIKMNQCGVTGLGCGEEVPLTMDPTDKDQPSLGTCSCVSDGIKTKSEKILTDEEWLECYNCLGEHVTPNRWKEMMRHLGLREGDIQLILLDHTNFREASYQMFLLWRIQNGQSASMSKVFHVLDKMELRGCKENVANDLISNGILVA
ncbi:uncharacterized protein LOC143929603 isoform X2 [Lithobates pipiens]